MSNRDFTIATRELTDALITFRRALERRDKAMHILTNVLTFIVVTLILVVSSLLIYVLIYLLTPFSFLEQPPTRQSAYVTNIPLSADLNAGLSLTYDTLNRPVLHMHK